MRPRWSSAVGGPAALVAAGVLLLLLLASPSPAGAELGASPCPDVQPTMPATLDPHRGSAGSATPTPLFVFEGVARRPYAPAKRSEPPSPLDNVAWEFRVDRVFEGTVGTYGTVGADGTLRRPLEMLLVSPQKVPTDAQGNVIDAWAAGARYRVSGYQYGVSSEAVEAVCARKFGPGGRFHAATPGPSRDSAEVRTAAQPHDERFRACGAPQAQYVLDTFGKFPGTVPSAFCLMYLRAHHLDTEFYDAFYQPGAYLRTHAEHLAKWHPHGAP